MRLLDATSALVSTAPRNPRGRIKGGLGPSRQRGSGFTHLRNSSMWTTAGAIFSTTSAMKLNLYRGLVSWWRPALAGSSRCISEAQTPPGTRPG